MQDFKPICKLYNRIKLSVDIGHKKFMLKEILPENVCPLAFHSVYPYLVTLLNGGWFDWVGHDEDVIVNCPSPEGVAMYVKTPSGDSPIRIKVEVMKKNDNCYKGYALKDTFIFNFNDETIFKFKLLDRIIPFIFSKEINNGEQNELSCNIDGEKIRCRIVFR